MRQFAPRARGIAAAVLVLGCAAELPAVGPRVVQAQVRGGSRVPSRPAVVDSSPTIETLNKALKALGATDRDYQGHREKAISHIAGAIHRLETAKGRGKSNAAIQQAASGKAPVASRTASTPEAASDESLRKAKKFLFAVHHELTDHTASRGHIRADAEVRTAIDEIIAALETSPAAKAAAPATSTTPGKAAR